MPAPAQTQTSKGADAFVRHYVDVLNYSSRTGDTSSLQKLAASDCVKCSALTDGIGEIYTSGGSIRGGGWTVTSVQPYGMRDGRYFIDATIDSSPQTLVRGDGTRESYDGARGRLRAFVLEPVEGGWKVAELDPTA